MPQAQFCIDCLSGSIHEGTPLGKIEDVAGTSSYVAPSPKSASNMTIILLTDVFGLALPNPKLLADEYSRHGFNVIVPDILHNDPIPGDAFNNVKSTEELFAIVGPWIPKHGSETVLSVVDPIIAKLKSQDQKIALLGFCFGGREVFHYASTDKVDVVCTMHPSFIEVPKDAEKVKIPISIHVAEGDELYPAETSKAAQAIFEKNGVPHENKIYSGEGVTHGFGSTLR